VQIAIFRCPALSPLFAIQSLYHYIDCRLIRERRQAEDGSQLPLLSLVKETLPAHAGLHVFPTGAFMNNIIYIVGLIVVVLFVLSLLGVY
jgi:small-conductance mechanosensitive channel